MPLPSGFRLLDEQPDPPAGQGPLWEIVDVRFGEATQWDLWVVLESGERSLQVTFSRPVSCRTQEKGGVTGWSEPLTHYLVAGNNFCVEALTTSPPTVSKPHMLSV